VYSFSKTINCKSIA